MTDLNKFPLASSFGNLVRDRAASGSKQEGFVRHFVHHVKEGFQTDSRVTLKTGAHVKRMKPLTVTS